MNSIWRDAIFMRALLLFMLAGYTVKGEAQSIRFEYITSADGISQSEIYAFLEDSRGFMWIGTVDGLNRYDGYNIEVYNIDKNDPNSLSNNTIRSLEEDNLGRIWIGTDDGLNFYDPETELIHQVKVPSHRTVFSVWSLFSQDQYLLVGTNDGLWTTNISSTDPGVIESNIHKIDNFTKNQISDQFVRTIVRSKFGGLWIVTNNNISRVAFQEYSDELVVIEDLPLGSFYNLVDAVEDSAGNLWIVSALNGLARYNPENQEVTLFKDSTYGSGLNSMKCSSLSIDRKGNLWVGTLDRGISFAEAESLSEEKVNFTSFQNTPGRSKGLNSNLIYSLYVSKHNHLWVGTIGSGVNIYNPDQKKFQHYKFHDAFGEEPNSNFIRSVYANGRDALWVGTHNDGLYLMNRENGEYRKLGFGTHAVFHIAKYSENKNLICTGEGLYLAELVNNTFKILSDNLHFYSSPVFYTVQSRDGVFWYAALNGLGRIRIINDEIVVDGFYSTDTEPGISANNCRVLFYDEKFNQLLVGTEGGGLNIIRLDEDLYPLQIEAYKTGTAPQSINNNYIRAILKDSEEKIWIGTYEGLNEMIPDTLTGTISFRNYTRNDGLPNNMIQLLVEDDSQSIWIGTNGGLSKFLPERDEFTNYTVEDGIQSKEFSEHTVYKMPDGEIIVGGINGINTFYPDQINVSPIKPQTTLTAFYLYNEVVKPHQKIGRKAPLDKSIVLTDTIILYPKQRNIGFEFSSMIYPDAEKIKYAYMLDGFDEDWQMTGAANRIANYTNLRYGKYRFMVKSTNPDGVWDAPREVFVHILTPFAYTWFAYVVYVLVIVLVFTFFMVRYTTKKKLLLTKEHAEKLHELDEMRTRFFINVSHDLRTPLTLITGPLDKLLQEKDLDRDSKSNLQLIKRNVKRLSYLVEQLLDVRKSESGILSPKLQQEEIIAFTKKEAAHFTYALKKKGLKLKIKSSADKITTSFDPGMISKVYFNILSNAIKYTDQGEIEIRIERVNRTEYRILDSAPDSFYVKIEVRDTGKGIPDAVKQKIFDRFYQAESQTIDGYGIGLSHTKELIDAHQGFVDAESEEEVGTTIQIFLPYDELADENEKTAVPSTEDLYVDAVTDPPVNPETEGIADKTLLIVEDNDDMRNFIVNELKSEYNILYASDGAEGLQIAESKVPDLIITDVMMPNMDGIEYCEKIKSNIKTSHIPVILLTAKIDPETKYRGIETGADDYIPKPFEIKYLKVRIKNLLHSRDELRKLFQKSHYLEPSAVTVTSLDEKFLSALKQAIETGLSDADFSISSLEAEMGMSHANFYRKIKGLTGQSGQELLQNMRMKRAHQILSEKNGIRISEVAYMVGFTNPKYFSKCFKETFGFAPSELRP